MLKLMQTVVFGGAAIMVSGTAFATDDSATYTVEAGSYALVATNELADGSSSVTYNTEASDTQSRASGEVIVIENDALTIRANDSYTLTLNFAADCAANGQPQFQLADDTSFGVVGIIDVGLSVLEGNTDRGTATVATDSSNTPVTDFASISDSCASNSRTIVFDVAINNRVEVHQYLFTITMDPSSAFEASSNAVYGANGEAPAGTYSLSMTATLN